MPGEFFFMAMGGLGVSLAGFAGLIAALDRRAESHNPVAVWRIRNIVIRGFIVTIVGFGTVAVYTVTQDVAMTVRIGSLLLVLLSLADWREFRAGPAWPDERQRRVVLLISAFLVALMLVNMAVASVGFLQLLLLAALGGAIGIFRNAVREIGIASEPPPKASGEEVDAL